MNPCKIRGAHGLTSGKRKQIPTPNEVGQLINGIDTKYKLVLIIMAYGGLRFSEATALTVKDLKIVGKAPHKHFEIQINKAVTESKGVFTVAEPKSKASKRTVALPLHFTPLIAKLLLERKLNQDSQLLVEAPKGGFLRNSVLRKALDSTCKKLGITRIHISIHCFRHFAATTYLEAGASIADLQTWLGDSTQSAALGYVHATKDKAQLANSMKIDI
jgi:integrase